MWSSQNRFGFRCPPVILAARKSVFFFIVFPAVLGPSPRLTRRTGVNSVQSVRSLTNEEDLANYGTGGEQRPVKACALHRDQSFRLDGAFTIPSREGAVTKRVLSLARLQLLRIASLGCAMSRTLLVTGQALR